MAYGIVHHFPGGTKEQYEASIARCIPAETPCRRARSFTRLARRLVAGRSWRSTTPRRIGSGFATTS